MSLVTNLTSNLVSGVTSNLIGGGVSLSGIAGILPNVLFEWDGTKTNSFNPAVDDQTIYNLADRDTYEFWTGISDSTTNDPTFNSPDFEFDGTQRITLKANTPFINRIHKTDETDLEVTFIVPVFIPSGYTGSFFLFGSANSSAESGFSVRYNASNHAWAYHQHNGSSNAATLLQVNEANFGNWNLVTICIQKTSGTGGNFKFKLNEDAIVTGTLETFGATTADAGDALQFSGVAGSSLLPDGSKLTSGAMINAYLSDTEINSAGSYYATAHERDIYINAPPVVLLGDFIPNPVFELSPALAASYTSGTTLKNVVASPADGEAQTAYDFNMKTSTFAGTAGTASAYFIPAATTNAPVIANGNTDFIVDMVNFGAGDWSYIFAGRTPTASSGHMIPFSTGAQSANASFNSSIDMYLLSSNRAYAIVNNSVGNTQNNVSFGGASSGEDKIFGVSYDSSTNIMTFFIGENTTGLTSATAISDNSASLATTLVRDLTISRTESSFGSFSTNGRLYTKALHAHTMSSAQFIAAKTALEARHGVTFQ